MAAPVAPPSSARSFSSVVRAAAADASAAADQHAFSMVVEKASTKSAVGIAARKNPLVGRQLVLVELDEQGRPLARHLLPAPTAPPKSGCFAMGPPPPPLRVAVGRAGKRERDERRRRAEAAASAGGASISSANTINNNSSRPLPPSLPLPPPIVTGAVSTAKVKLASATVSSSQAFLLVGHTLLQNRYLNSVGVAAASTASGIGGGRGGDQGNHLRASWGTAAATAASQAMTTPLSVVGCPDARHPTLLLRPHGGGESSSKWRSPMWSELRRALAATRAVSTTTSTKRKPKWEQHLQSQLLKHQEEGEDDDEQGEGEQGKENSNKGRNAKARVILPEETTRLRLGDVLVFGGSICVVEAEATASRRLAGVALGSTASKSALARSAAQVRQRLWQQMQAQFPDLELRPGNIHRALIQKQEELRERREREREREKEQKQQEREKEQKQQEKQHEQQKHKEQQNHEQQHTSLARSAAAAALPPIAPTATATATTTPTTTTANTGPPPLRVRLSNCVSGDPALAALAKRSRLSIAPLGDHEWSVFVTLPPPAPSPSPPNARRPSGGVAKGNNGNNCGGGFSRSLNWLLSLAGRRAVVSPAWMEEVAKLVEAEEAKAAAEANKNKRRKKDSRGEKLPPSSHPLPGFVRAPATAPHAIRDAAAEERNKFTLSPSVLCGWHNGKIALREEEEGEGEATAATATSEEKEQGDEGSKRKAPPPRSTGEDGGAEEVAPRRRPARILDGITVVPSPALLALESDGGVGLLALVAAAGGLHVRQVPPAARGRAGAVAAARTPVAAAPAASTATTPLFAAAPAVATRTPLSTLSRPGTTTIAPSSSTPLARGRSTTTALSQQRPLSPRASLPLRWVGLAADASPRERAWAKACLPRGARVLSRSAFVEAVIRQRVPERHGVLFLAGEEA